MRMKKRLKSLVTNKWQSLKIGEKNMKQLVFVVGLIFVLTVIMTCSEISQAQSNEIQTNEKVYWIPSSPSGKNFLVFVSLS